MKSTAKPTDEELRELHLHLKGEYFDAIKAGMKTEEFRLRTPYFGTLLAKAPFKSIVLYRGYPKSDDATRTMRRAWRGFRETTITHPHFGPLPVQVYAINVRLAAIDRAATSAEGEA